MSNHSPSNQSKICSILQQTRIVLVEPAGPLNVGSAARVMKNFGLHRLTIVRPQCDPWGDQARQMAVHAQDLLHSAIVTESLSEALQGCHYTIATTGRSDAIPFPLSSPRSLLQRCHGMPPGWELAIVFGREDRGLTHQELALAHQVMEIPTSAEYASLNLAQAVAVCCYELFQTTIGLRGDRIPAAADGSPNIPPKQTSPESTSLLPTAPLPATHLPAPVEQLEGFYQQLEHLLLQIGYLYPHTAASRMEKFRHLYQRANPSPQEVAMLRGILRQMDWALKHP